MSIKTPSPDGEEPPEEDLTEDQREMLEYIRDHSDRLEEVADRMLQEESDSEVSSS